MRGIKGTTVEREERSNKRDEFQSFPKVQLGRERRRNVARDGIMKLNSVCRVTI